jgi:hypothetical protein
MSGVKAPRSIAPGKEFPWPSAGLFLCPIVFLVFGPLSPTTVMEREEPPREGRGHPMACLGIAFVAARTYRHAASCGRHGSKGSPPTALLALARGCGGATPDARRWLPTDGDRPAVRLGSLPGPSLPWRCNDSLGLRGAAAPARADKTGTPARGRVCPPLGAATVGQS